MLRLKASGYAFQATPRQDAVARKGAELEEIKAVKK